MYNYLRSVNPSEDDSPSDATYDDPNEGNHDEESVDNCSSSEEGSQPGVNFNHHDENNHEEEAETEEGDEDESFDFNSLSKRTIAQLKELARARGLPLTYRKKSDLIDRLLGIQDDNPHNKTVPELKSILRELNEPTGGKKKDLVKRVLGLEEFEEGSFEDFDRYTNAELVEKLKTTNADHQGNREDLINRLMGKEPPMPDVKWEDSDDKSLLMKALKEQGEHSVRFKTVEEVHQMRPFNRWPLYRFRTYFKNALLSRLRSESIADQDNADFLALVQENPIPERNHRGESKEITIRHSIVY
jgi:hypothetical protein